MLAKLSLRFKTILRPKDGGQRVEKDSKCWLLYANTNRLVIIVRINLGPQFWIGLREDVLLCSLLKGILYIFLVESD